MKTLYVLAAMRLGLMNSYGSDSVSDKIALAQSAAHPAVSKQATVLDMDGKILKEGTNGWTCLPGVLASGGKPMCNDALWMKMMKAIKSKTDFKADRIGISYMMQGDSMVSNSSPYATDKNNHTLRIVGVVNPFKDGSLGVALTSRPASTNCARKSVNGPIFWPTLASSSAPI